MYHYVMREIALALVLASCGGPVLANAPRPPTAAVAGGAAGVAAVLTAIDPNAATRKPEKKVDGPGQPVEVKETVPSDVLDRLDQRGSGAQPEPSPSAKTTKKKRPGPGAHVPTPREAVDHPERSP
jgi:hypothetical protein